MMIADITTVDATRQKVVPSLHHTLEQFLYAEARLLDSEAYDAWFALVTEDIHYWMPSMENRYRDDREGVFHESRMAFFDDYHKDLARRVKRFGVPTAWTENPRVRHLHTISNVEAFHTKKANEYEVHSVFVNYRNSRETDTETIFGRRQDILREVSGSLKIARRTILVAQNVLLAKNINTFF
ncbi:3-phenylpropionate/cinnamic acid dioxygenase subunit beta [Kordiimonas pumila]|uniref:3-phenylpropionate/cinnamic acid dioxygenase subunit beta n=1 Tax=Kordiimonas pumila TaxID=2161677 RepID=A0ABV7D1F8_9PROT|nr:3-phenylpropionate/cinnamic acid dioxygenase subunit beta [Kordiimonas pumila]